MTTTQDIQFAVTGQSLILDCEDGRPASITDVQVWSTSADDTSTEEAATTGSAAVETNPNTTLSAAGGSGVDPTSLTVTSATSIAVARVYRLAAASGLYEDVTIASVSGTTVTVKQPLINDYPSGSTLKSCRATIGIDATWVADLNNLSPTWTPNPAYRVRWTVVDGAGATQVYDRYFDLVRYAARHGVTPPMVEARWPGWLDGLPLDCRTDQGRSIIDRAFKALRFDLYGDNKADQAIRNAEAVAELTILRAQLLAIEDAATTGGGVDGNRYENAKKVYDQRYQQFVRAPVIAVDTSGGGAAQPIAPTPLWRR
ncbi:MAG: hypothetical protein IPJ61_20735 [Tessaracoccus sp.]|uniref:hypothetical protein n=1 Tax=Tessaracoccus sp. TaxID=1971211 RepID=UPI001EB3E9B4|nr:hypothetical protein [Tessaracoccus sp.]MBK7823416.1 hypothetical protein [Tessaracoccus sp.]